MNRFTTFTLAAASALAVIFLADRATAQGNPNCGPTTRVNDVLANTYGESVVFEGLRPDGLVMRVFMNPVSGSWSIVADDPRGITCLLSSGDLSVTFAPTNPGDPA